MSLGGIVWRPSLIPQAYNAVAFGRACCLERVRPRDWRLFSGGELLGQGTTAREAVRSAAWKHDQDTRDAALVLAGEQHGAGA